MNASVIREMEELKDSPAEKLTETHNCCHQVAEFWKDRGQEHSLVDREGIIIPLLLLEEGPLKLDLLTPSHTQKFQQKGGHVLIRYSLGRLRKKKKKCQRKQKPNWNMLFSHSTGHSRNARPRRYP